MPLYWTMQYIKYNNTSVYPVGENESVISDPIASKVMGVNSAQ